MSIRLRPMGKPCLRSPRGALLVVAGAVALATAPATAAYADHVKDLGWYAEEAAVPATVQFHDVATDGTTVLAAGQDGDALTGTAAIYRRVGDAWQAETLPTTLASPSVITDVAVSGSEEWAVGTEAGEPVVLQKTGGAWLEPQMPPLEDGVGLTSVAVNGSKALVGDSHGKIHVFEAGVVTPEEPLAAGAINDIALTGVGVGFAVADQGEAVPGPFPVFGENSVRIYALTNDPESPEPDAEARARTAGTHMTAVAAAPNGGAVALDSMQATWHLTTDGGWAQGAEMSGASLAGVSSVNLTATDVREALVGTVGTEGAIWQRDRYKGHDAPWQRQPLAAGTKPLAGVTLTGPASGFAVGVDGTILRLWQPPDPERHAADEKAAADAAYQAYLDELAAEEAANQAAAAEAERQEQERLAAEQAAADQAAAEQAAADQAAAEQQQEPTAETSSPPPPPVEQDDIRMNGVVIDDSEPRETRTGQRLLKNVRAVRRGQKLIVSVRLTAKARVGLTAKRGRRVIAKTGMRTLRRGRRQLVLRFSGRPPSSLKVVVRRVSGARDNR